jgi:hypothetical protein
MFMGSHAIVVKSPGLRVHAMSTIEIAAMAQARLCGAHPEGSVRPRQFEQSISLAAADRRDDPVGNALYFSFMAALFTGR